MEDKFWLMSELRKWRQDLQRNLDLLAIRISDENTIKFTSASISIIIALVLLAAIFVSLKFHQSSIARWDNSYGIQQVERWVDFGSPKAIRADEWNVQTPWILNQVQRGMPVKNGNVGGAESPFVASTPVFHPVIIFQPKYWGFLFLDIERGYSWVWAYKIFGLLGSFFLLFLFLTRGDLLISVAGAVWIWGSSFVQWWFSSHVAEQLIGFSVGLLGMLYLLQARRRLGMLFGSALMVYGLATLLLHVYPPFIVPLVYLGFFVILSWMTRPNALKVMQQDGRYRAGVASLAFMCGLIFVWMWAGSAFETIKVMMQTVYPGRRYELGGGLPLSRVFSGFFEAMRNNEADVPLMPSNASEASGFLLLFPLIMIMVNPKVVWRGQHCILGGLLLYCFFVLAWMSFPLPLSIREVIATLGWSMTFPVRAEIGLGVGSIMAVTLLGSILTTEGNRATHHFRSIVFIAAVGVVLLIWGLFLREIDPTFFHLDRLALGLLLTLAIVSALVYRIRIGFVVAIGLFVIPALSVNPLQSGLGGLLSKPALTLAVRQGQANNDLWAVIGDLMFSQGLKARGLNVVTGTHYVPNLNWIKVLDPLLEKSAIWNRYAHVGYESAPDVKSPFFVLLAADQYIVRLDVCSGVLQKLGVNRVAYTGDVSLQDQNCLEELETAEGSGVRLFKLLNANAPKKVLP